MTWTRKLTKIGLFAFCIGAAQAQLDLLTPREAVQIVALIPEVAEARKQGFCPRFSAAYGDRLDRLGVQVRDECGPNAGQWINSYTVDLRTGASFQMETKETVNNPEGEALAKRLLNGAAARLLSLEEARCLALDAAKSLPGWSGPGHHVSIEPFGVIGWRFHVRLTTDAPPTTTGRYLTVDPSTARVHDDEAGMEVVSPSLTSLASKMLILHLPLLLSDFDALEIARAIPEIRAEETKPCSTFQLDGPLSWEDIYVAVVSHCEGSSETSSILVGVNPETGVVTDPDGKKQFGSAGALQLAMQRLEELKRDRVATQKSLNAACHVQ